MGPGASFQWGGQLERLLPGTHVPGRWWQDAASSGVDAWGEMLGSGASLSLLGCTWWDLQPQQQCVPWLFPFSPFVGAWFPAAARAALAVVHGLLVAWFLCCGAPELESPGASSGGAWA